MKIREWPLFDETHRGGVICFGLARKAGDDVGTDSGVRESLMDQFEAAGSASAKCELMRNRTKRSPL